MIKLNILSTEVVNQIAAGEVIERPASIVKELLDNSVDAESSEITVKLFEGGMEKIEVLDNGIGIPRENMERVFDAHTTSKIEKIEDLNTLLSMGFRGEALSTITAVSRVKLTSKFKEDSTGSQIVYNENGKSDVKSFPKEAGTHIVVENIFYNLPARKKYLKSSSTEYRKVLEVFTKYVLVYPNIHFKLEKDGKVVFDLENIPNSKRGEVSLERVLKILNIQNKEEVLNISYSGNGMEIAGYISHPSKHQNKSNKQYLFVNERPVYDKGVFRAIYEGYARFLPFGQKVDFVVTLRIEPKLVDVNVHPRKEEVRFENPFRVYSAVEECVKHTLEKELKNESMPTNSFASLRESYNSNYPSNKTYQTTKIYTPNNSTSVRDTLLFSKELLKDISEPEEKIASSIEGEIRNIFQIFNKYIVLEFTDERLWIVDQHAAAERINFEKLLNSNSLNRQSFLVAEEINFSQTEIEFLEEAKSFFDEIGFSYTTTEKGILLTTTPAEFVGADFRKIFTEILDMEDVQISSNNLQKRRDDILATVACHGSVRSGQQLAREEMFEIHKALSQCKNPYSCPHGRPAIWKLTLKEIDDNFERTY